MENLAEPLLRLLSALLLGSLVGLERSFHGRPAGFRTHALVCMSTALLMLVSAQPAQWLSPVEDARAVIDPTRMAQGIMTGIGFIGAGAIVKDGLTVSGLTTAAALWITAAIGILLGIGYWGPALAATLLTLLVLAAFRHVESRLPAEYSARFSVRYARAQAPEEPDLRALVQGHGLALSRLAICLDARADWVEYRMAVSAPDAVRARQLAGTLARSAGVLEYRLSPMGD